MSLFVVDHRVKLVFHVGDSGSRVFRCHWATCGQNSRNQENIQKWSCSAPAAPEDHRAASQHSPSSASFSLSRLLSLPPAASSPATSSTDSTNTTHATNANIHGKQPSSSPSSWLPPSSLASQASFPLWFRLLLHVLVSYHPSRSSLSTSFLPLFKCSFISDGLLVLVDDTKPKSSSLVAFPGKLRYILEAHLRSQNVFSSKSFTKKQLSSMVYWRGINHENQFCHDWPLTVLSKVAWSHFTFYAPLKKLKASLFNCSLYYSSPSSEKTRLTLFRWACSTR